NRTLVSSELKCGLSPMLEKGSRIELAEDFDQRRHQPSPSGLMAGADAGTIVAMEIFVEQQVIPPVRIVLEFLGAAEYWPQPILFAQKDPLQPIGDRASDLEQVHDVARASRTFDPEFVAIVQIILHQRADQQHVDGHPNWPAPVRVAAEHPGIRL